MLELIKEELVESGVSSAQFISLNFEDLNYTHLQTAKALHDEITNRASEIDGKVYLFFDEIQEIVYLELLRRDYKVTVGRIGDKEIDFVCDRRGEKLYVQVAYLMAFDETIQCEFGVYDNIRDNYPKYVVSLDEFDMSRNGIKHRNIQNFLLAEEWN